MTNEVKLTIITPVFNGEMYIENCILQVLKQNCPYVEHLIVDGVSTDKTIEIVQKYSKDYPHINLISGKDNGQSDAMNKGIRLARGDIIGFLNIDDFYEPNVFNRVLDIFKNLPVPSFLVGNCNIIDFTQDTIGKLWFVNKPKKLHITDLLLGSSINPHPMNPTAYFYHKTLHEKAGFYNEDEHFLMDLDFIFRAVQHANVKYVDEMWGNFCYHQGAKTFRDRQSGQQDERHWKVTNSTFGNRLRW